MLPRKRVLCVDDDKNVLAICRQYLESVGYLVETAENGIECGCKLAEFLPDVIVLDFAMPEFCGRKTIGYLLSSRTKVAKVIVFSGCLNEADMNYLNSKNIPWLMKPLPSLQVLCDAIEGVVQKVA